MPRFRVATILFFLLAWCIAPAAHAQSSAAADTTMPTTGLDFSGIDQFWKIVDELRKDIAPTEAQWHALLSTPGYRLAEISIGKTVRQDLEIAFKPSRRAELDSLTMLSDDRASRLKHLVRAASRRAELDALRDSLSRGVPVADAKRLAQQFLPVGATALGDAPLVAFAVFRNDAYSQRQGVIVDLMNVLENGLNPMLAHEFHHTYLNRAANLRPVTDREAPDVGVARAFALLRSEGIADLIDKTYPLAWTNPVRAAYVKRYNDEYARTPATLRAVDSLLAIAADDSTQLRDIGQRVQTLFWSVGHPNGAFVARTIYETFGVDSLLPGVYNPAAFLRAYAAAEQKHGRPAPFSPKGLRVIQRLEAGYWTR